MLFAEVVKYISVHMIIEFCFLLSSSSRLVLQTLVTGGEEILQCLVRKTESSEVNNNPLPIYLILC